MVSAWVTSIWADGRLDGETWWHVVGKKNWTNPEISLLQYNTFILYWWLLVSWLYKTYKTSLDEVTLICEKVWSSLFSVVGTDQTVLPENNWQVTHWLLKWSLVITDRCPWMCPCAACTHYFSNTLQQGHVRRVYSGVLQRVILNYFLINCKLWAVSRSWSPSALRPLCPVPAFLTDSHSECTMRASLQPRCSAAICWGLSARLCVPERSPHPTQSSAPAVGLPPQTNPSLSHRPPC